MRAVPAAETHVVAGWTAMAGSGALQRTNSVTTFGEDPDDLSAAVDAVECWYGHRGRPTHFRLTDLDASLDELLGRRGYERSPDVAVMTAPTMDRRADPSVDPTAGDVTVASSPSAGWLHALGALGGYDRVRIDEIAAGLGALDLPHGAFRIDDRAVGLAVVDGGWVGLFDIAVAAAARRSGIGRRITSAMLTWSARHGAAHAYLQVVSTNLPAVGLYRGLGFETAYRYWYRTEARPEPPR